MTQVERRNWLTGGQIAASCTLALLLFGCAVHVVAQYGAEQVNQAAVNATLVERLESLSRRVASLETQNNWVLASVVGTLIAQLFQLRGSRK